MNEPLDIDMIAERAHHWGEAVKPFIEARDGADRKAAFDAMIEGCTDANDLVGLLMLTGATLSDLVATIVNAGWQGGGLTEGVNTVIDDQVQKFQIDLVYGQTTDEAGPSEEGGLG